MDNVLTKTRRQDTNVGDTERMLSTVGGGSLLAYGLARKDKAGLGLAVLGGVLLHRGVTGHCNMYQALGINRRTREGKGSGQGIGVPYELGFRVDHSVRIDRPRADVYRFWRNFENLPRFMNSLEKVEILDDKRSRWVAKAPAGMTASWDAEIINEIDNEVIGWRSLPGSWVDTGGSVRFDDAPGGSTDLKVSLQYNPPAGTVGRAIAKFLGEDPAEQIRQDLDSFKQLMETGVVSRSNPAKNNAKAGPLRGGATKKGMWDRDQVVQSSEESFPASDAPSWTPEKV